jgi:hypothetical protein
MVGWGLQDFELVRLEPVVRWRLETELVVVLQALAL